MIRRLFVLGAVLFVIALLIGTAVGWHGYRTLTMPATYPAPQALTVERGESFSAVAVKLAGMGVLDEPMWLRLWGRLYPDKAVIRAGEYEIDAGMTPLEIVEKLREGDVRSWTVQFIEGWTFKQVRQALEREEHLGKQLTELTDAQIMGRLGQEGEHPEGRFFPDTYHYTSEATDLTVLRRAYERMQKVLDEAWETRAEGLPYESPYEALIMASIVEKETGVPQERNRIAGVFVRRLERGMRLQTDPTVIYGMGENYDGNITRADLRRYTAYNTYRIDGLPPTPIAMPGQGAVRAALNPAEGSALYFVARGDGSHVFSDTLAAHNRAVREYQLRRRSNYRSAPAEEEQD